MPRLKILRSLRGKLVAAFLLLDLVILVLILRIVSRDTYAALEERIQFQISQTLKEYSNSIARELDFTWVWLASIAGNPVIVDGLTNSGGLARQIKPFMHQLTLPGLRGKDSIIRLLDARGRVVADNKTDVAPTGDFSGEGWFRDAVSRGDSRVELYVGSENSTILFSRPVFAGNKPAGALTAEFHIDFAYALLAGEKNFQPALLTPSGQRILGGLTKAEAENLAAFRQEPGKQGIFSKDGILYCIGSFRSPAETGTEFLLVLSAPLLEINRPIQALTRRLLTAGFLAACALTALLYWLAGKLLKPLKSLEETMEAVMLEGDLSQRATITTRDEVGILSGVYNRMLDSLAEKNRQLRLLADITSTTPLPVILADEAMRVKVWNEAAEKLFGWREEEISGRSLFDTLVPEDERETVRRLYAGPDQNGTAGFETVRRSKDGALIPVESLSRKLKDADGRFLGNIVIYKDLREIRRLQEVMLQTEKMGAICQLAAGVAHEINNPLGIILGFAQSLVKRIKEDDPMAMPLKSIERETVRCTNLVQDLLVFSRSSKLEQEQLDLNEALTGALSLIFARARTRGVEIVRELSPDLPRIPANRNKLQQVLINLANNAIDAMSKGGTLTIGTALSARRSGYVEIRVRDTGHGIPEGIRTRVMEPFFTTKEVGKGTGLGLALVYEIVKSHNGGIELESEEGKGTCFTVFLPIKAGKPPAESQPESCSQ